jgi:VWFA-related protein
MGRSLFSLLLIALLVSLSGAQQPDTKQRVRTVTIPISIFTKKELKDKQAEEFVQAEQLTVQEDKEDQQILSIRSVGTTPLSIAFVIQEDLRGNFNLQLKDIQSFIRDLPKGTRVMVAYIRSGNTEIRQRFTIDLERAASSLRIVSGNAAFAPRSPYDGVNDVLNRFDAVPAGRRAVLLFSDGLDTTAGLNLASVMQSFDLDRAVLKAQRKGVALYSIYNPTALTEDTSSPLSLGGEGALQRLSEETGGRAFSHGTIAPLNYLPFFQDMVLALNRQFALTYLSTHMKKGYHKVLVQSTNPEIRIEHPAGYYYR